MPNARPRPLARVVATAFSVDALFVVVFAIIGRASHDHDLSAVGVGATAWPFLAALVIGWTATVAWRAPLRPVRTGVGIWLVTVAGGMLLRAASAQGTAIAFVIVATLTLGVLLVGWRVVAAVVARAARRVRPRSRRRAS